MSQQKTHNVHGANKEGVLFPIQANWLTLRGFSRELRIRVPTFSVVYFSRGTLPTKKRGEKGHLAGDLD